MNQHCWFMLLHMGADRKCKSENYERINWSTLILIQIFLDCISTFLLNAALLLLISSIPSFFLHVTGINYPLSFPWIFPMIFIGFCHETYEHVPWNLHFPMIFRWFWVSPIWWCGHSLFVQVEDGLDRAAMIEATLGTLPLDIAMAAMERLTIYRLYRWLTYGTHITEVIDDNRMEYPSGLKTSIDYRHIIYNDPRWTNIAMETWPFIDDLPITHIKNLLISQSYASLSERKWWDRNGNMGCNICPINFGMQNKHACPCVPYGYR